MTVKARSGDAAGAVIDSQITVLTNQIAGISSPAHRDPLQAKLDQLQREAVYHYLDVGRITAANVLSTLT